MHSNDEQRIDAAVKRAGRACAAIVERRLETTYGHDWLETVNKERAAKGRSTGHGSHDNRFVLAMVAHEQALAYAFDDDERVAARQLNAIANARAHDDPVTADDAERAEALADRLARHSASYGGFSGGGTLGPYVPNVTFGERVTGSGDGGMIIEEDVVASVTVGLLLVAIWVLPGWYEHVAQALVVALAAVGVWRGIELLPWDLGRIGEAVAALAVAAAGVVSLLTLTGWWEAAAVLIFLGVAWLGAQLVAEELGDL